MTTTRKPEFQGLPADAVGWQAIVEPAKDAYWLARRNGHNENTALLEALDIAVAKATGQRA